jgi:YidC/Oxa1 family membrane protein insertase
MNLKITVENRGDKPISEHLMVDMFGHQDPSIKAGGFLGPRVVQTEGMCNVNGKLRHGDLQSLLKASLDENGSVRWIGVDEKYFVAAVALNPGSDSQHCVVSGSVDGNITSSVTLAERRIAPKDKAEINLAAFFGPKLLAQLDEVKVAGVDAKMGDAINYGWTEAIARPMLAVLKGVHFAVPNWGAAVIVLTILLKLITWWPTTKSMKSMKAMAKLKPEMDKLKEKYGLDKEKMNQKVMELYKEHNINPLGGCLPMLIQMPIYIALYSMLGNSVELYRSGFLGWIHDLTAPDPYFVLPILTGALMFAQQRLSPAPPDPNQKMMGYMMPVMFTAISLFLPSGLTVYILTNTLLTMVQQWWMNRNEPKPTRVTGKPARA